MLIEQIIEIVRQSVGLSDSSIELTEDTPLIGHLPEFDSQSVVTILLGLEEVFPITISDDEVSAEMFVTIGTIRDFVASKVDASVTS